MSPCLTLHIMERSSALFYTLGVVAIEKGKFGLPSTTVDQLIYIYIYIYIYREREREREREKHKERERERESEEGT